MLLTLTDDLLLAGSFILVLGMLIGSIWFGYSLVNKDE